MSTTEHRHSAMASQRSFWTSRHAEVEETAVVASKIQNAKPVEMLSGKFSAARQSLPDISSRKERMCGDSLTRGQCSLLDVSKTAEKRGAKAEKTITLQMLRQYFAGSLKDAARNIGGKHCCSGVLREKHLICCSVG